METVKLMNRVNPFTIDPRKNIEFQLANISRNSFHLNVYSLVYFVFSKINTIGPFDSYGMTLGSKKVRALDLTLLAC